MKLKSSIFFKLLVFILPLVCLPIALVGYFSIQASVERVNRLVRQEQMLQVEAAAKKIDNVLHNTRIDLTTITGLPLIEQYNLARSFRLRAEAEFNHDNIVRLFKDFLARTPSYWQLRYIDASGRELIKVRRGGQGGAAASVAEQPFFRAVRAQPAGGLYFSPLVASPDRGGYILHCAKATASPWERFTGVVVIDLDFERITAIVRAIHVGHKGYAFMVDDQGRNLIHPNQPPYTLGPESGAASLRRMLEDMTKGGTGWQSYHFENEDKVAAYAPVPALKWSVAATIPAQEFRQEADAIRTRVFQVVVIVLILAVAGVSILSYNLLKPVRSLAAATERLAEGGEAQELPVTSRDELGELTRAFNRMSRNLERTRAELVRSEKLVSLGRLSAGVAHEIRNPLSAMAGAMVHLQRRRPDDPLIAEYGKIISEEIERLNRFVTEFLYFARQAPPHLAPTDLNALCASVQTLFRSETDKRGIRLHNLLDKALPLQMLDPHQMEQVLVNLMINAMDALPRGGYITFTTTCQLPAAGRGGWVRLSMEDNGVGIHPQQQANVFDPFFTTKDAGTGLGLTLSLGIVQSHGGAMEVLSAVGKGTTIIINLPFCPVPPETPEAAHA
ncbi:MAG: HAMP domain-containing protein [Desulfarculaceae bacterium]|nr:HAMP domain-containing protein [Desulfarculaceae bacterium]MCF8071583.1 HAMP domain-containing protein [Desulfarculaceae bacterium]MCF8102398.1 HAMP domain-containing protein [Desulfarculaceae bacterium]MCF8114862.1 HAMP domain-containing protein [Desulfarculaceae bacterium]